MTRWIEWVNFDEVVSVAKSSLEFVFTWRMKRRLILASSFSDLWIRLVSRTKTVELFCSRCCLWIMMKTLDRESFTWSLISAYDFFKLLRIKITAMIFEECSRRKIFLTDVMMKFDQKLTKQEGFKNEEIDEIIDFKRAVRWHILFDCTRDAFHTSTCIRIKAD